MSHSYAVLGFCAKSVSDVEQNDFKNRGVNCKTATEEKAKNINKTIAKNLDVFCSNENYTIRLIEYDLFYHVQLC